MTPLGWGWALFVWGYALAWFLVNDRVKLLAYRFIDPVKAEPKKTDTLSDMTPQIAKRAYELYERGGGWTHSELLIGVNSWKVYLTISCKRDKSKLVILFLVIG